MRGRGNGRKNSNPRSHNYESNGPEVKVRGNAQQVVEKYLAMARDATLTDDRVAAENYFQHAEHYYRLMTANGGGSEQRDQQGGGRPADTDGQPQENAAPSVSAETPRKEPEQPSAEAPVKDASAVEQVTPVEDPASAPQPEIGDGDGARPE
jgi:Domain of unknown function (DUF4167)